MPQHSLTIEEVLAQLDRVGYRPPGTQLDFDRKELARLRTWMKADNSAEGGRNRPRRDLTSQ